MSAEAKITDGAAKAPVKEETNEATAQGNKPVSNEAIQQSGKLPETVETKLPAEADAVDSFAKAGEEESTDKPVETEGKGSPLESNSYTK